MAQTVTTPNIVTLPPDSTGKSLDTSQQVIGGNTVQRENLGIGDPNSPTVATVINDNSLSVTDLSVREILYLLLLEIRGMRAAIVQIVTENGDFRDSDFDPNNIDFQ